MRPLHALLSLTAVLSMSAQEAIAPKLAVFLPERIISTSVRGRKLFSELEVLKKNLEEKISAKGEEGRKITAQLQSPSLSEAGHDQLTKQLRDLDYEFKKLQEDSQAEYGKTQQKVFTQFQSEVGPIVTEYAKELKLQLVIQQQQGLIAYADDVWLLAFTNEVAKRYDAKFENGAPAPAPAAKATTKPAVKK